MSRKLALNFGEKSWFRTPIFLRWSTASNSVIANCVNFDQRTCYSSRKINAYVFLKKRVHVFQETSLLNIHVNQMNISDGCQGFQRFVC